jgi:hypothetical protein
MSDPFVNGVDGASVFDDLDACKANFEEPVDAEELLTEIPVRKPRKSWFVRAHPEMRQDAWLIEDEESRELFYVLPHMYAELADYCRGFTLHPAVNRQGLHFLWIVPAADPNGRKNDWHATHRTALEVARTKWVQVIPDMSNGRYRVRVAKAVYAEPEWRPESLNELLKIAFEDRIISDHKHPVAKRLLGLG